jgi:hypothetical protein
MKIDTEILQGIKRVHHALKNYLLFFLLLPFSTLALAQDVTFSPTSLSWGAVSVGQTSAAKTITLTNTQSSALTISGIVFPTGSDFYQSASNCPLAPATVAAGGTCTISIAFRPLATGTRTATMSVLDDAPSSPQTFSLTGTGGTGPVIFSPTSLGFPSTNTGSTSAIQTATLTNTQSTAVTFASIAATGMFKQTNDCPSSLPANSSCTISVSFAPTSTGSKTGYVNANLGSTLLQLYLSGTATAAGSGSVTFSPTSLSFPSTTIGATSAAQTATLTNGQAGPLTISSLTVAGDFAQTATTCPVAPATLAASGSCTISLNFQPQAAGTRSGSLTVSDNASGSPQVLSLTGTGASSSGSVTLTPASLTFPSTTVGSTSAAQTATLSNTLATSVSVTSITASTQFAQTNNCPSSLPANGTCTISVTFKPTSTGTQTGSLNASLSSGPLQVSLSGTGGASTGSVTVSPKQYTFPTQAPGVTSAPVNVTLTNGLSTALTISSIQLAAPFSQTNNCGSSLAGGASCTIVMTYSPTVKGYSTATLTINDNAANSPQTVAVAGNAMPPVTVTPSSLSISFYNQIVKTSSTPLPVTITNNASTAINISGVTSTADFPFTGNCSGSLAFNASCTIQVSFDPQATGVRSGKLTVASDAAGGIPAISLSGSGITNPASTTVEVGPPYTCALPSGTRQFTAQVTFNSNTAVKWYVDGVLGGSSTAGTITPGGLYTAPASTATHTVKAVSQAVTSVSGSTTVAVTTTPSFVLYPSSASVQVSGQQTFQGQECNAPDTNNVSYTVDNIAGGNATVGTITSAGVYSAPAVAGTHTIRATDTAINKSSASTVTVYGNVAVDFGSRTNTAHSIPANILGAGRGEALRNESQFAQLTQAGVTTTRLYAQLETIYATQTPNWKVIDNLLAMVQAAGQHPLIQMSRTPAWLQPTSGSCKGQTAAMPTNVTQWAQLAQAFVAHVDASFPGLVQDYEIWNEPNTGSLCSSNKQADYLTIYAATAPLMKQQAATDGVSIRLGGPVTSYANVTFTQALLANTSTAPYVDFVSYHQYLYGNTQLDAQWDSYNIAQSIYQVTQSAAASNFNSISSILKAGKQPGGAQTPVFITEFNTNWAFAPDCCRNDPVYGPLWNALYISDLLNTVYSGTQAVPARLVYFAANAYPYFCLIGVPDQNSDCMNSSGSTLEPYPQYYTFQLLGSNNYLGLMNGGYMAASITPATRQGGLVVTGFYNSTNGSPQDAIVIVNPTGATYSQLPIVANNVGISSPQATLYQVVNGASINSSSVSLTQQGSGYTATINVPPYSVQAISLKGQ